MDIEPNGNALRRFGFESLFSTQPALTVITVVKECARSTVKERRERWRKK